ncbi:chemotaxis protein CheW [Desulfitobacterium sp. Sab5]|uniref:chemotaxis protein CheW n=1 Tax=Desulfitobacterium nosdiversum TaxID=3375356 RepID=UPI003CF64A0F
MSIQFVIFELDDMEFGLEITAVNSILRARKFKLQTLPGTNKSIEGIINVRGNINFIFNLRTKFNFVEKEIIEQSKFIMLNSNNTNSGFRVDEVTDIIKLNDEEINQVPNFTCGINDNYIVGIGTVEDRMIIILDPEKIFTAEIATLDSIRC